MQEAWVMQDHRLITVRYTYWCRASHPQKWVISGMPDVFPPHTRTNLIPSPTEALLQSCIGEAECLKVKHSSVYVLLPSLKQEFIQWLTFCHSNNACVPLLQYKLTKSLHIPSHDHKG